MHPAFRRSRHYPTTTTPATTYPPPTSTAAEANIETKTDTDSDTTDTITTDTDTITTSNPHPSPNSNSPTPELFDTGFYRGRLELPANSLRELINIPFTERQRQTQQKQLYCSAGQPSPIITSDGAILSANFNCFPVDPDSHAMSFMDYDSACDLTPEPQPPGSRCEWRRGSKEARERMKERFRRRS
ncbi:hypothetical protein BJX76DRAFT_362553 [Aspergillus varians]